MIVLYVSKTGGVVPVKGKEGVGRRRHASMVTKSTRYTHSLQSAEENSFKIYSHKIHMHMNKMVTKCTRYSHSLHMLSTWHLHSVQCKTVLTYVQ